MIFLKKLKDTGIVENPKNGIKNPSHNRGLADIGKYKGKVRRR